MAAARLVLGSAILGLFCSGYPKLLTTANRCDSAPCTCDAFGRLECDCKDGAEELILSSEGALALSPHMSRITVSNCRWVSVANSTFASMSNLGSVDLQNIANLTLQPQSFEVSPQISVKTRISIQNSTLDVLPSSVFHGNIGTIELQDVRIGQVHAFAFANINKTDTINIKNCRITQLDPQAFKKFDVNNLHIIKSNLGDMIPSKTMNDIEVYNYFMLDGVQMGTVRSFAFIMRRPVTVAIRNCLIQSLEGEAFDVSARGAIIIQNNTFGNLALGAFLGIKADRENRPASSTTYIDFKDNSLISFEEGSLMFQRGSFSVQLENVLVRQPCDCQQIPIWKNNILNYTNVYARLPAGLSASAAPPAPDTTSDDPESFFCLNGASDDAAPVSFAIFESRSCALSKSMLILGISLGALVLVLLVAALLGVYCCRRRKRHNSRKRWMSVPTSAPDVVSKKNGVIGKDASASGGPVDSRITMVVPDGRLYKETEFHVIVEKAEPLTTEL